MANNVLKAGLMAGALLAVPVPAAADVKAGVDAWSRGDYAAAVKQWTGPAAQGDADAQFNLAQAYKLGRGVERDLGKAEELFGKAAAKGHMQASDNYGLLVFQRGDHARAMPYVKTAAGRGDARAQYVLGLAYFNGDSVDKDWVRAYALVSLAQQADLPQAIPALAQMDKHIPIEQRRQSIRLATEIAAEAQANRQRQVATVDLGGPMRGAGSSGVTTSMSSAAAGAPSQIPRMPVIARATDALGESTVPAAPSSPEIAGADYARPQRPATPPVVTTAPRPVRVAAATPAPRPPVAAKPAPRPQVTPASAPTPASSSGAWRVQLGAFGVPGNADAMWNKVKARPELSGHARMNVPAGRVIKLQAGGFASQDDAAAACRRLSAAGFDCIAVRN